MSTEKACAVLRGPKNIELDKVAVKEPGPGEVQIATKAVGICGSDINLWESGQFFGVPLTNTYLGHECGGVITKVGSNVTHLKIGDKVALKPTIPCENCTYCQTPNGFVLCEKIQTVGIPPYPVGGLMQSIVHPAQYVYKLPDSMSMDEAASVEPLNVAHRACVKAGISAGSKVLITGAGPIGMCCLLVAKVLGAASVTVTDLDDKRLEVAKSVGATHIFKPQKDEDPVAAAKRVVKEADGVPDCVLESSGAESAINMAILAIRKGGIIVNSGFPHGNANINLSMVIMKEVQLRGNLGYLDRYEDVISMVASGSIDVNPLVSHHFPLSKAQEAFETAARREGLKIMINCDEL